VSRGVTLLEIGHATRFFALRNPLRSCGNPAACSHKFPAPCGEPRKALAAGEACACASWKVLGCFGTSNPFGMHTKLGPISALCNVLYACPVQDAQSSSPAHTQLSCYTLFTHPAPAASIQLQ